VDREGLSLQVIDGYQILIPFHYELIDCGNIILSFCLGKALIKTFFELCSSGHLWSLCLLERETW